MTPERSQRVLHAAQIMWPAFLAAGVLEMLVFSWVDPSLLRWGSWQPDSQTIYSLTFLAFWALIAVASLVSHWMMKPLTPAAMPALARRATPARRLQRARHAQHHHA